MTSKVFVGNLAFQTTDQALAEAFQDCLGKVKTAVVITRGRRSLGYGFVEFDNPEFAVEAVKSKNNTNLKGRVLKVELASDNPVRDPEIRGNNPERSNNTAASSRESSGNIGGGQGDRPAPRRKRNIRRRRMGGKPGEGMMNPNQENKPASSSQGIAASAPGTVTVPANHQPKVSSSIPVSSSAPSSSADNARAFRNRRPPTKRPQNIEDRVLSKTAVFVANLPFGVKDEELLQFFKDNNAKTAHVVVTRNGRSRGYGFVDFDSEIDQSNAINSKNNLKFPNSDRQISVTPSYKTQELQLAGN
jgi:RNA recognition motif-containing protein